MKRDLIILVLALGVLSARVVFYLNNQRQYKEGSLIRVTTRIHSEPVRYDNSQYLRLFGLKAYLPLYPEVGYGDFVVIEGQVSKGSLINLKLVEVRPASGVLYKVRKDLVDFYSRSLPKPHSSLIQGVTIGSKAGLSSEFWNKLKNTGTAHVVVASGMNVTLVAGFLINFFTIFFKRRKALVFALLGIWVYAFVAGMDAPIVRAAVMGSITFGAQELGRLNVSLRSLLISAFFMLFIAPFWVMDLGFWLSFMATLSIILFEPKLKRLLKSAPSILRQDLSTTLSAQIGVAPILYFSFGQLNFLSPLINVFVLWTIVPITVLGILSGLISLVFEPVGTLILWITYPLTAWFILIVNIFS